MVACLSRFDLFRWRKNDTFPADTSFWSTNDHPTSGRALTKNKTSGFNAGSAMKPINSGSLRVSSGTPVSATTCQGRFRLEYEKIWLSLCARLEKSINFISIIWIYHLTWCCRCWTSLAGFKKWSSGNCPGRLCLRIWHPKETCQKTTLELRKFHHKQICITHLLLLDRPNIDLPALCTSSNADWKISLFTASSNGSVATKSSEPRMPAFLGSGWPLGPLYLKKTLPKIRIPNWVQKVRNEMGKWFWIYDSHAFFHEDRWEI